jgi:hypothetical protein
MSSIFKNCNENGFELTVIAKKNLSGNLSQKIYQRCLFRNFSENLVASGSELFNEGDLVSRFSF